MFIPFAIPTSVKTQKQWVINMVETPFFGGYLIMFVALLPPFITGWIAGKMITPLLNYSEHWVITVFISGLILFFWDRWLRFSYDTEIKLINIPVEYLAYITMVISLIFIYA